MTAAMVASVVILLVLAFAFLFRRLAARVDRRIDTAQWLEGFSLDRYRPMSRLLDERDFAFFSRQPGATPALTRRLRADRRKIFLAYLNLLIRDFNQLMWTGRILQVSSQVDRPEFARALWRQQSRFYFGVCFTWCRLVLFPLGRPSDGRKLVASLDQIFGQVRALALAHNAAS